MPMPYMVSRKNEGKPHTHSSGGQNPGNTLESQSRTPRSVFTKALPSRSPTQSRRASQDSRRTQAKRADEHAAGFSGLSMRAACGPLATGIGHSICLRKSQLSAIAILADRPAHRFSRRVRKTAGEAPLFLLGARSTKIVLLYYYP